MVRNTLENKFLLVCRIMDQIMDLSLTVAWVIDIFFEKLILQIKDLI